MLLRHLHFERLLNAQTPLDSDGAFEVSIGAMPYLTDMLISETAPRDQDYFVWDTEIPGFGLKITPAGNKTFVFQWRPGGRSSASRRRRIGRYGEIHVEHARRMAGEARAAIQSHKAGEPGTASTVGPLPEGELEARLASFFDGRSSSRSKIMSAATKTFMREGSEASLETIALAAGVARPTIYRYFPSKEELLREVIAAISESTLTFVIDLEQPPYPALLAFAQAYRKLCLDEQQLALYRLSMTSTQYHADIFQIAGVRSQQRIHDKLSKYMRHAMKTGKLRRADPGRAAEFFMSSVLGFARVRALVGFGQTSQHLDAYIAEAVETFVRGMSPKGPPPEGLQTT